MKNRKSGIFIFIDLKREFERLKDIQNELIRENEMQLVGRYQIKGEREM